MKGVTGTQQQRHESPTVLLTWHASKYKVQKPHHKYTLNRFVDDVFLHAYPAQDNEKNDKKSCGTRWNSKTRYRN